MRLEGHANSPTRINQSSSLEKMKGIHWIQERNMNTTNKKMLRYTNKNTSHFK
jgi:hypothetical protein